jgi:hypothetical protein
VEQMTLKEQFLQQAKNTKKGFDVLVTAVKLPTGAVEVITNTQNIESKIDYLKTAYDDDFKLNNNKDVQIVGFMLV